MQACRWFIRMAAFARRKCSSLALKAQVDQSAWKRTAFALPLFDRQSMHITAKCQFRGTRSPSISVATYSWRFNDNCNNVCFCLLIFFHCGVGVCKLMSTFAGKNLFQQKCWTAVHCRIEYNDFCLLFALIGFSIPSKWMHANWQLNSMCLVKYHSSNNVQKMACFIGPVEVDALIADHSIDLL